MPVSLKLPTSRQKTGTIPWAYSFSNTKLTTINTTRADDTNRYRYTWTPLDQGRKKKWKYFRRFSQEHPEGPGGEFWAKKGMILLRQSMSIIWRKKINNDPPNVFTPSLLNSYRHARTFLSTACVRQAQNTVGGHTKFFRIYRRCHQHNALFTSLHWTVLGHERVG